MRLSKIWLNDFRSYDELELSLGDGLTAVLGPNGVGKTNLMEAIGLLATLKSFRGAPTESMIRRGADRAIVRAEGERDGREVLIELELAKGRTRVQVNRQKLARSRDLLGALRVTVFAPDDLSLVKDGPSVRREYLDDLIVALDPRADQLLSDFERVVRQRNALLKAAPQRVDEMTRSTLDVWDMQFASLGERVLEARYAVLTELMPLVVDSYERLSASAAVVVATYRPSWGDQSLAAALEDVRETDFRRRVSTLGPHRDDVVLGLNGLASRTEASQGEQRTLALGLRLAGHRLIADRIGDPPLLLLDDVLSELDPDRATALLATLPPGQTVISSASGLPPATVPEQILRYDGSTFQQDAAI